MEIIMEIDSYTVSYDSGKPNFKEGDLYLGYTVGFAIGRENEVPPSWHIGKIQSRNHAKLSNVVYRCFKINYIK